MDVSKKLLFAQKTLTDDGPQDRPDDDEIEDDDTDDNTGNVTPPAASGQSGKYGWYELPQFKYSQSGSYMIDATDSDLYYAHHICAGGERGPGGRTARNYTVCFSAEHHCPVWVAAPRHSMYESGASRTDAYGKDPNIPSDIQYNSKSTGGGCNKGHMLGSAERLSTSATNKQVFYYTNIAPQYSDTFNNGGGGWNILEDWVDGQVCSDTLYVVIGAYFDNYTDKRGNSASPKKISFGGRSDVSCPTMFYYILMRTKSGNSGKSLSQCKASEIKCAAFVRSHKTEKGTKVSSQDLMSVSDLEKVTGFTYFPNVPHAPKSTYSASDWGL
ncbi:MAG: DNA/RNA non-specific endonuclease [Bacteroidales bacterium]|nr:DNA/RNA non-specific endonuclease [Bacteroidales bacterium]